MLKVSDNKSCVKFSYVDPTSKVDLNKSSEVIQHFLSFRDAEQLRMFVDTTYEGQ